MAEYLLTHPCVDCGITDIRVLEFDHRDGKQGRQYSLAVRIYKVGLEGLKAELAKCDVRCANCHRIRTFSQLNWKARVLPGASGDPPPDVQRPSNEGIAV